MMKKQWEKLMKGEYPIYIDRRRIYDLIVEKTKDYKSEKPKKLSRTVK